MSEQVVNALFTRFGMSLGVDSERFEHFDDVVDAIVAGVTDEVDEFLGRSEDVTGLDIENFDVVFGVVDEVDEIVDVWVEIVLLSLSLLKLRLEALTISFFTGFV